MEYKTLQEAKEAMAKRHGHKDWKWVDANCAYRDCMDMADEAAELYAKSCRKDGWEKGVRDLRERFIELAPEYGEDCVYFVDDISDPHYNECVPEEEQVPDFMKFGQVCVEGNNGGNFVKIEQLSENTLHLEVGDCCVITINEVLTAEALSGFLSALWMESNKPFLELVASKLRWTKEINERYMKGCKTPEKP